MIALALLDLTPAHAADFVLGATSAPIAFENLEVDWADGDGDGDLDAIYGSYWGYVFVNHQTPSWSAFQNRGNGPWGGYFTASVQFIEFDGDPEKEALWVAGGRVRTQQYGVSGGGAEVAPDGMHWGRAADLDGDGRDEIFACPTAGGPAKVYRYDTGTSAWAVAWTSPTNVSTYSRPLIADFTGDGALDVFLTDQSGGRAHLWARGAGLTFTDAWQGPTGRDQREIIAADVDGDGDTDVFAQDWGSATQFAWFENDGHGAFTLHDYVGPTVAATTALSAGRYDLAGGDEIAIAAGDHTEIVRWDGAAFASVAAPSALGTVRDVDFVDVDGLGGDELIVAADAVQLWGWDTDLDGVIDALDSCDGPNGLDADADGVPDACDACPTGDDAADIDGDGMPDACDACAAGDDGLDADADGVPDACDACSGDDLTGDLDADGLCDGTDKCQGVNSTGDTDKDGTCNDRDLCLGDDATDDADADGLCGDRDKCFGGNGSGDVDQDGVCGDLDECLGDDDVGDLDLDGVCDDRDLCDGDDATRDLDGDGACGDVDLCDGDDLLGDADDDGACDDRDLCDGDDAAGDADADGVCGDLDPCFGDAASGDADEDGVCDDRDPCAGDDNAHDWDGDATCDDRDPPAVLQADGPYAVLADDETTIDAAEGVLVNDAFVGGAIAVTTAPLHGEVTLRQDGGFTYAPDDPAYNGPDWFEYTWADADDALTATVSLSVGDGVLDAIVANEDSYATAYDADLVVDAAEGVLANDIGDGLTVTLDDRPAFGEVTLSADGGFTYVPAADQPGADHFSYVATDGTQTVTGRVVVLLDEPPADTAIDDPYDGARLRCGPPVGPPGVGTPALALALALALNARRKERRDA